MRSLKRYEAKIDKAFIVAEETENLQLFSDIVLSKGRIFLIDEFREYLSKDLGKSNISTSACISRVKRIDKECFLKYKEIDLLLYLPFIISTSKEMASNILERMEKSLSVEMSRREYSNKNIFPNRQFSDCKSAFAKYREFLQSCMHTQQDVDKFVVKNRKLYIPKLSKYGLEAIENQIKAL